MTQTPAATPAADAAGALFAAPIASLPKIHAGKVRDIFAVGGEHMLIVTTDRLSAFDVILPTPVPGKGAVLTRLTAFWMARFASRLPNQMAPGMRLEDWLTPQEIAATAGRAVIVRKLKALPVECVARGYLIGSGWKDYQAGGQVCGHALPPGLAMAGRLPAPLFTPAWKAPAGQHDQNIDMARTAELVGPARAEELRAVTLALYAEAAAYARDRGIIIADTKFEFGVDADGVLHLIDEVLTPDSSRFWPVDGYQPGSSPPSFDKQYVRDYLETLPDWNKQAPGPALPPEVVRATAARYHEAEARLMGPATTPTAPTTAA